MFSVAPKMSIQLDFFCFCLMFALSNWADLHHWPIQLGVYGEAVEEDDWT